MQLTHFNLELPASKDEVFDYLSDIDRFPEWATEFCRGLRVQQGYYKVVTADGELFLQIDADRRTGVIDFHTGPTPEPGSDALTTRVLARPDGGSIYVVSFLQPPDLPNDVYVQQCRSLERELENIRRHFS